MNNKARGLSLIELMVGIAVGAMVIGMAIGGFSNWSATKKDQSLEDANTSVESLYTILKKEIISAGAFSDFRLLKDQTPHAENVRKRFFTIDRCALNVNSANAITGCTKITNDSGPLNQCITFMNQPENQANQINWSGYRLRDNKLEMFRITTDFSNDANRDAFLQQANSQQACIQTSGGGNALLSRINWRTISNEQDLSVKRFRLCSIRAKNIDELKRAPPNFCFPNASSDHGTAVGSLDSAWLEISGRLKTAQGETDYLTRLGIISFANAMQLREIE